jgi:hypothetical protein
MSFDRNQKKARAPYLKKQFHGAPEFRESDRNYLRYHDYWTGLSSSGLTASAGPCGGLAGAAGSGRR